MRVRANHFYIFEPVGMDLYRPAHTGLTSGELVQVVNLPGCPKANTMGHCHVNHRTELGLAWEFAGLVLCNSLRPLTTDEKKIFCHLGRV